MSQEFDLGLLKELEQEIILNVLCRDQMLRKVDEARISKLKLQLQQLRWKGIKNTTCDYRKQSCARCQRPLGILINRGAVCKGCSHQICARCRISRNAFQWKCTICHAYEDVKVKTGEWFFEERAKKFPDEAEIEQPYIIRTDRTLHPLICTYTSEERNIQLHRHETAGAKLLKSYQNLSCISVIPPTPPPVADSTQKNNTVELNQSKSFHRSMENLFLSFTTHMKKISKSQNDVTNENHLLTANYRQQNDPVKERRTLSDTAIDISSGIKKAPSIEQLTGGEQADGRISLKKATSEEIISTKILNDSLDARRGSSYSLSSSCSETWSFANADVCGEIEFAVRYLFKFGILEVCVSACKNLAYGEEEKKKCNPYVETYLLPDKSLQSKRKTSVKKNTLNPTFQEILKYKIEYSQLKTRQLQISVCHSGIFRHRVFLGEVVIPFESWDFESNAAQSFSWYQLKAKD